MTQIPAEPSGYGVEHELKEREQRQGSELEGCP